MTPEASAHPRRRTPALRLLTPFALLALLALGRHAQKPVLSPGDHTFTLRSGGRTRRYIVHVPDSVRANRDLPLMIAFHGGGGNAQGFKAYAGLDAVADSAGFLVAYPDGTGPLPQRLLTWNAGGCCGWAMDHHIDDVAFTIDVIADITRRTRVDQQRIYATGHSNGAIMAYRLAAERADRIAAIVPVAGAMSVTTFSPSRPVAVLDIHSVDDPRALYNGGLGPPFPLTNHRETHQPVQQGLDAWIRADGCPTDPTVAETRRGHPAARDSAQTATRLVWAPCNDGAEVQHWKLTGAGHGWPGAARAELPENLIGPPTTLVNAARTAWAFASRFTRQ